MVALEAEIPSKLEKRPGEQYVGKKAKGEQSETKPAVGKRDRVRVLQAPEWHCLYSQRGEKPLKA